MRRAEAVGDYRRRVEVIEELAFVVETDDFPAVVAKLEALRRTHAAACSSTSDTAMFALSVRNPAAHSRGRPGRIGGLALIRCTGSARPPAQAHRGHRQPDEH